MHGRVKVRTTAEQEALKKVERAKKLAQYRAGISVVFQKRKDKVWDNELLSITERMLLRNPDIYTLWNIRRETFQNNTWNEEDYQDILEKELILTENCLRENPKSYSIWHQRCWVLEHMQKPNWKRELGLCTKCLNIDERNFHCWDYRQYIVHKAKVPDEEEFDFSTQKILSNFSNYSSWHYRSKVLSKMFHSRELVNVDDKQQEELKLVMNAAFTDPNDSSAWFYQRWLLDTCNTSPTLWRIRITKDVATVVFDKDVIIESEMFSLFMNGNKTNVQWKSYENRKFAKVWFSKFIDTLENLDTAKDVYVTFQESTFKLSYSYLEQGWIYKTDLILNNCSINEEPLLEQLESYKSLAEMEPNNKWALLTGVFLMKRINFVEYHKTILDHLDTLAIIDTLRFNYYKDLRSKYLLDYTLHMIWINENEFEMQSKIDLAGLDLTMLYENQHFSFFQEVNLSANQLGNSLHQLFPLQNCKNLSLANNHIKSLKHFPILHNLRVLSLKDNKLTNLDEILELIKRHKLMKLDLRGNPVTETCDIGSHVKNNFPDVELHV